MEARDERPSSLKAFEPIRAASPCLFARSSRVIGCPAASATAGAQEIAALLAPGLSELCAHVAPSLVEGVVIELVDPGRGDTIAHLARTVRDVLNEVARVDDDARASMAEPIGAPDWWFRFAGVELLLVTFAPCYPAAHPRASFGPSTFLLFQPHAVFARRRPPGSEHFPVDVKRAIREAFDASGRGYDARLSASSIEALKFVKPLHASDPPVEWWRAGIE